MELILRFTLLGMRLVGLEEVVEGDLGLNDAAMTVSFDAIRSYHCYIQRIVRFGRIMESSQFITQVHFVVCINQLFRPTKWLNPQSVYLGSHIADV